jgi:hypothetical protein
MPRFVLLFLSLFALSTTAVVVATSVVPTSVQAASAKKKTKKKKTTKKKPAAKKKTASYTYSGSGTINTVGSDDMTLTVDVTKSNRTLAKVLGGSTGALDVTVADTTAFSFDGDTDTDFFDICSGDAVSISVTTKQRLTLDTFKTVPATSVTVTSSDSDCEPSSIDE